MSDEIKLTIILLALLVFIAGLVGAYPFLQYLECHTKAEKQGLECTWGIIQGCMVKIDGKWVDYDRFRIMD